MTETQISLPPDIGADVRQRVEVAVERLTELHIQDREYALDKADLPDGMDARTDGNGLWYVVHGEKPMFDEVVAAVDTDGDVRIAAQWASRKSHWSERDYAGRAYDAMEEVGIDRPQGPEWRDVGVQFGADGSVSVENAIRMEDK